MLLMMPSGVQGIACEAGLTLEFAHDIERCIKHDAEHATTIATPIPNAELKT
jgi:hypothetical protein